MKRTAKTILLVVVASTGILWLTGSLGTVFGWDDGPTSITISKETTYITEPLMSDGMVDYIAAVNASLAEINPDDNAAVLLARAFGPKAIDKRIAREYFQLLRIDPPPDEGEYLMDLVEWMEVKKIDDKGLLQKCEDLGRTFWAEKDVPKYAEMLAANEKPLQLVIAATKRNKFAAPILSPTQPPMLMNGLLESVQSTRSCARLLSARAMMRAAKGDLDGAFSDVDAIHRLANLIGGSAPIIQGLVATALHGVAFQAEDTLALSGRVSPGTLRQRAKVAAGWPPPFDVKRSIGYWERILALDGASVSMHYGADVASKMNAGPLPKLAPSAAMHDEALRTINVYFDRLERIVAINERDVRNKEMAELDADLSAAVQKTRSRASTFFLFRPNAEPHPRGSKAAAGKELAETLMGLHFPAMRMVDGALLRSAARQRQTVLAYALAAYRKERRRYPDSLDAKELGVASETLIDPFTDKPFVYRVENGKRHVVSAGMDEIVGPKIKPHDKTATAADRATMPPVDDIVLQLP